MKRSILIIISVIAFFSCSNHHEALIAYQKRYANLQHNNRALDTTSIANNLSLALQIPTRSLVGEHSRDGEYFLKFHDFLQETYPLIHKYSEKTIINKYSLVLKFKGSDTTLLPGAYIAHMDVVPASDEESWAHPPFSGVIDSGYVYGRGAQDMKSTIVALMGAMETLLSEGFTPQRDIYFCFGHDEEVPTQDGAAHIANWLDEQGIKLDFLIDEGGTILDGSNVSNIPHRFALIGICEKGYVDIKLTVRRDGGHGSLPIAPTAVSILSKAFIEIEQHPMDPVLTPALRLTLESIAPYLPSKYRRMANNPDVYFPVAKNILKHIPLANALISTTFTPTMLNASSLQNVIPYKVTGSINTRIIHGYTCEDVKRHIQKVVGKRVEVSFTGGTDPTPMSDVNSINYDRFTKTIVTSFPEVVPIPYMFIANTDSRYYRHVCDNIFLFTPFELKPTDQKRLHGVNERCSIKGLAAATQFFIHCIESMSKK